MGEPVLIDLPLEPKDQGVIEALEDLLEKARDGKVSAVACAVVYRDGCTGDVNSALPNRSVMLGSIARLQHRLMMKDYE
jgi:hypothetical protein